MYFVLRQILFLLLKEYRKIYYPKNKTKILARNKNLYYLNKEKRLAQCKEYRLKNIEKDRLVKQRYKQNNKDKIFIQNCLITKED